MRKLLLLVSAFLVACGGGGGGGGSSGLSGNVGGRAFSPVEVKAIPAGTGTSPCTVAIGGQNASIGVKAVAIEVTSYADACGDFASSDCRFHANAQSVTILVGKVDLLGTEPALTTGTYKIFPSLTSLDPAGGTLYRIGFADALATSATCTGTPSLVNTGTVRLDKVTDPVTGHVSITFQDGSTLEGDFSAPVCAGLSPNICEKAANEAICTLPGTCVQ